MIQTTAALPVTCYFDPITDLCVGATLPDGEQQWLAGSSQCPHTDVGWYLLLLLVHATYSNVFYEFDKSPLGMTAEQLKPYAIQHG